MRIYRSLGQDVDIPAKLLQLRSESTGLEFNNENVDVKQIMLMCMT